MSFNKTSLIRTKLKCKIIIRLPECFLLVRADNNGASVLAEAFEKIQDSTDKVKPKVVFELGETVRVTDGPFLGQSGIVEKVDEARGKLAVSISIFGQSVSVDLEYWQVERGE